MRVRFAAWADPSGGDASRGPVTWQHEFHGHDPGVSSRPGAGDDADQVVKLTRSPREVLQDNERSRLERKASILEGHAQQVLDDVVAEPPELVSAGFDASGEFYIVGGPLDGELSQPEDNHGRVPAQCLGHCALAAARWTEQREESVSTRRHRHMNDLKASYTIITARLIVSISTSSLDSSCFAVFGGGGRLS